MCKEMRNRAVAWGRTMANWYHVKNKPQHPGVSQAHSIMNLASPFICLSMCNSCAASLPQGWSPQTSPVNAPLLQQYSKLCFNWVNWILHPLDEVTLKQNCFLVKFIVPLKGRSNPDISLPHFNYSQCFLHASNLPWMQQSILRTRIGEQLTHLNWTEKKKVWNREKNVQWKLAQSLVVSWYPCIFLFPSAVFPWLSFCKPCSSFICKLVDPRNSLGSSSAVQGTCVQLHTFILPGTRSYIINCGVFNINFRLMTLLQIYSSHTVKSTHIWIIP